MDRFRVLLATDGSPGAARASELLASSVDPLGVEVIDVMAVVGHPSEPDRMPLPTAAAILSERQRETAAQHVRIAAGFLGAAGFATTETVHEGHSAEMILTQAATTGTDLIVLGTRGMSGLRRVVVGSVSGKVARYATTSVLVARTAGPIRTIILAYDASPDADTAMDLLNSLPLRGGPEVIVYSAYDVIKPLGSGLAPTMVAQVRRAYHDSLDWAREAAEVMASGACQQLVEEGVRAVPRTVRGRPHEQLAIVARESAADLIVVGSRGLSAVQRFLLGSTSAALVDHPPTSILVARGTAISGSGSRDGVPTPVV